MQLGNYKVHPIETGSFALDGGAMFGIIPKPLWEKKIPADDKNRIKMALRVMLIEWNDGSRVRRAIVDTGMGDKWSEREFGIYALTMEETSMPKSLFAHGLASGDITDVILTHLHFDHAGGATLRNFEGDIVPAFPNATYYVQKKNYDHAENPTPRDAGSYRSENWRALVDAGKLVIMDGPEELFPGLDFFISDGHTIGQQLPILRTPDGCIAYCGDLVPTSAHLPMPWIMGYDIQPLVILEEKERFLKQAAKEDWILFFEHDFSVPAARIEDTGKTAVVRERVF
ncbi:MAG: MBL fold metallo-hydrolase [Planctomycetes bacterium]|nr:MBL fold metallo-hydrolase [Planctomycetota bacterium]